MTNDMQIQQDVLAALCQDPNVVADAIGVEVHHGVVKLAGHVSDHATMKGAECAAHRVNGVTSVVMDVDIAGPNSAPRAVVI